MNLSIAPKQSACSAAKFSRTKLQPRPALARGDAGLTMYWHRVLLPVITSIRDDGTLAVFLNQQIDEWEIEDEFGDGRAAQTFAVPDGPLSVNFAKRVMSLLQDRLAALGAKNGGQEMPA